MFFSLVFVAGLFSLASGITITGQYACVIQGNYKLCNNQWGIEYGTGSQSATLIGTSGNKISWSTTWTWADNEDDVKTYTNVESMTAKGMKLCEITSARTAWNWEYVTKSEVIHADVSYDIWIGRTPDGVQASSTSSYEIMIWVSGLGGVEPVGTLRNADVDIAGYTWNVWEGPNSNWETISFVSRDGDITDFSADLNEFFSWIIKHKSVSSSLYLQAIETGTEPFIGHAELLTHSYSVSVTTHQ